MKSLEVKSHLLWYLLYDRQYLAAATEYGGHGSDGIADVFGISKAVMTHEFEVKVSKSDLAGEIHAIRYEMDRKQESTLFGPPPRSARKTSKHSFYLDNREGHHLSAFRQKPNHFTFVVPESLADFAIEGCKGTPYGVLSFISTGSLTSRKNVGRLHKEPVDQKVLYSFLHKLSMEVSTLRRKQVQDTVDMVINNPHSTEEYRQTLTRSSPLCAIEWVRRSTMPNLTTNGAGPMYYHPGTNSVIGGVSGSGDSATRGQTNVGHG